MKREAEQLGTTVDALQRELRAERPRLDVMVMAYGKQERLSGVLDHPKHFLLLNGEPLIARTVRLVRELADGPICLCAPMTPDFGAVAYLFKTAIGGAVLAEELGLVANMVDSHPYDDESEDADPDVLYLLGDVVWSPEDLWIVLHDHHPSPVFYGRQENPITKKWHPEIFALRAHPSFLAPFVDCRTLWDLHSRIGATTPFRAMHGYTDDVDTPEDLAERLPLLQSFVEREVRP